MTVRPARVPRSRRRARPAGLRALATLAGTHDALLTIDAAGRIDTANPAAERLLGYDSGALAGRDLSAILDLEDGHATHAVLADRTARCRDGRTLNVDVALAVMDDDHLIVSLRDIDARLRGERARNELISTISHELRTPLTSVIGSLTLLRTAVAADLPPEALRLIDIADANGRRLVRLINDLLDIDGMEAGKLAMVRAPVDLCGVVDRTRFATEALAAGSGIVLACSLPARAAMVAADADRVAQVIANLLSNAIHAAPAGSRVLLSMTIEDAHATVCVEDRGPGIPPDFRDRVFERFETRRIGRHGNGTGTGLGLAIAREIVQRHDGTIRFEDRPGGGTRFAFTLPLLMAAA